MLVQLYPSCKVVTFIQIIKHCCITNVVDVCSTLPPPDGPGHFRVTVECIKHGASGTLFRVKLFVGFVRRTLESQSVTKEPRATPLPFPGSRGGVGGGVSKAAPLPAAFTPSMNELVLSFVIAIIVYNFKWTKQIKRGPRKKKARGAKGCPPVSQNNWVTNPLPLNDTHPPSKNKERERETASVSSPSRHLSLWLASFMPLNHIHSQKRGGGSELGGRDTRGRGGGGNLVTGDRFKAHCVLGYTSRH